MHPKLIYRAVKAMPKSKAHYYSLRNAGTSGLNEIAKAARFIYLNRNCFNGVFRTNRKGQFNVPRGRDAGAIPNQTHFLRCSYALRKANLLHGDFEGVVNHARQGDFVYLDPPYAKQGARRRGEYGYASFDTPDVKRLATCLQELDQKGAVFLLSYADCREIRAISSGWYARRILVRRHVAGFLRHRTVVREVLISNRDLKFQKAPRSC
jgi:DNA adenine methylase